MVNKFPHRSAIEQLFEQPQRFDFMQAVRVLQRWMVQQEGITPAQVLSGRLHFRNSLSLAFASSQIEKFELLSAANGADEQPQPSIEGNFRSRDIKQVEITPAFMGLLGASGALPVFYTELFARREQDTKDSSARAFLDIFLNRALVLFYQAWCKNRLEVQFEQDHRNQFLPLVLSIAGIGHSALRDRLKATQGGVSDHALAFYAGVLQQRPLPAQMLRRVLEHYLGVPVKLEQFVGRWYSLPKSNETRIGIANAILGRTALAGQRVWQRDLRQRLTLGPLTRSLFRRFLVGAPGAVAIQELLTLFTGVSMEYEVRLLLRADHVTPMRLTEGDAPRLGWDSFVVTHAQENARDDASYTVHGLS